MYVLAALCGHTIVSQFEELGFEGEKAEIASLSFLSTASQIGGGKCSKAITELLQL